MARKFQNKYRIPSARWQSWDYSSDGLYFITINVANHACLFGTIVDKEMYLLEYGQIANDEWKKSIEIRQELFCDTYVIMPNHIHAILRIENPDIHVIQDVTTHINTLRHTKGTLVWQERFHDHVIRDYEECRRIGAYIDSNIENWKEDRYCIS